MAGEKILVVDDEASVSGLVSVLLERSGYVAVTASRPEEALLGLGERLRISTWCSPT